MVIPEEYIVQKFYQHAGTPFSTFDIMVVTFTNTCDHSRKSSFGQCAHSVSKASASTGSRECGFVDALAFETE